jgi:Ca-activated chloride channel family protein
MLQLLAPHCFAGGGHPFIGCRDVDWSPQPPQFRAGVNQVEVYATVVDREGRPVRDLTARDFTVLEDSVPQTVTTFAAGEFPATVALVIDRSFSMAGAPLTMARTAGRVFLASLRPDDRAMLIGIGSEVEVLAPLGTDRAPAGAALDVLDAWSSTSLHDAIIASLDLLESESGRRAIVLLSDGGDRYSRATAEDVVARVRESNVLIYPIAIGQKSVPLFTEIASYSGGRAIALQNPKTMSKALQSVAEELRWQYLLGYEPTAPWGEEATWRSLSVTAARPRVAVRARRGYMTK